MALAVVHATSSGSTSSSADGIMPRVDVCYDSTLGGSDGGTDRLLGVVTTTPCIYLGRNRLLQQLQITSGTGTAKVSSNGDGAKIRRGWRWGEYTLPEEGL